MLQAIFLGIVQGLTEFIPVSSSGHLEVIPELLNWHIQSTAFDVFIHGGTLLVLLIVYRKRVWKILISLNPKGEKNKNDRKVALNIIIATIPAAILGYFYQRFLDERLKSIYLAAAMLFIVGLAFILVEIWLKRKNSSEDDNKKEETKTYLDLKPINALSIGLIQPIAFLRGTSRSGITILAGLWQKMDLKNAVDFSFFMSIPIISIAFVYETLKIIKDGAGGESTFHLAVGFVSAFISGLIAINFMLKFINKIGLKWFGFYRIILSIVILIIALK